MSDRAKLSIMLAGLALYGIIWGAAFVATDPQPFVIIGAGGGMFVALVAFIWFAP